MSIADRIVRWHRNYGRHHLPWQKSRNRYRVWISEIMLQQTQVKTVIPYYERFMQRFPTLTSLAEASESDVMQSWAGLGYYRRARFMHRASQMLHQDKQSDLPSTPEALIALPGIGQSTAHAILSLSLNLPYAILDGNVKRVLARHFAITEPLVKTHIIKKLWTLAQENMCPKHCREYTQGIMDLGANICARQPLCDQCPINETCLARKRKIQQSLPAKIPRKTKKVKRMYCLCYLKNDSVLMIQRPDTGIWPRLWVPPMTEDFTTEGGDMTVCESFRHTFTHFHMDIIPVLIHEDIADKHRGSWFKRTEARQVAIPAPIHQVLDLCFEKSQV